MLYLWNFCLGGTRSAARLNDFLHQMKLNPGLAFVLGDGEQRKLIVMSQVRRQTVAVDVGEPFPFGGVGVASSGVFALKMLELAVNVVSIAWKERKLLD